jgi:hypothetical protein
MYFECLGVLLPVGPLVFGTGCPCKVCGEVNRKITPRGTSRSSLFLLSSSLKKIKPGNNFMQRGNIPVGVSTWYIWHGRALPGV